MKYPLYKVQTFSKPLPETQSPVGVLSSAPVVHLVSGVSSYLKSSMRATPTGHLAHLIHLSKCLTLHSSVMLIHVGILYT